MGASGDDGSRHIKPTIQEKETQIHPDMAALLIDCWSENAEIRPSIRRVRLNTESVLKWLVFFEKNLIVVLQFTKWQPLPHRTDGDILGRERTEYPKFLLFIQN